MQKLVVFVMAVLAIAVPCLAREHKDKKAARGAKHAVHSSGPARRTVSVRSSSRSGASHSGRRERSSSRYARTQRRGQGRGKARREKHVARSPKQLSPSAERYQQIQQALADRGYFHGTPDGAWGPDSVDALKRFQADQSLKPDGKLGSMSLIALGLGPRRLSAQTHERPAPQNVPPSTEPLQEKP